MCYEPARCHARRLTVEGDLEGARGHELTLDGVRDEEAHHDAHHLVARQPCPPGRRGPAQVLEGIATGQQQANERELDHGDELTGVRVEARRGEVVAVYGD